MDFWFVLSNVVVVVLLAWYGLGKLVSKNLFARWFFETKIARGYEKERLEKFKDKRFLLSDFGKEPILGEKFSKILKLCGANVIFSESGRSLSYPLWELSLVDKQENDYRFKLIYRGPQLITYNLTVSKLFDAFSFLINDIAGIL